MVSLINARTGNFTHSVYAMDGCYDALPLIRGAENPPELPEAFAKAGMPKSIFGCRALLKDYAPDLLVTYNWGSVEWVLGNRFFPLCPMVHVQDGFGAEEQEHQIARRRIIRSFAYRGCDAVVAPSRKLEVLARNRWGISKRKLHYIPNGIDVDRFIRPADKSILTHFGLTPEDRIIGTVAALRPEKNLGRLIEAFHQVAELYTNTKLVIVGGGMGRSALQMLAERIGLKDRVIFTGPMPEPEAIIPAFEIFALSSDTEQMPLSVVEAMAAGLPVVSTDVGDIRAMVSEGNEDFIEGKSAASLAKSLSAMLDRRDTGHRIGAANQHKAKSEYSLKTMVEKYDTLFLDVLKGFRK
ncbi:MAG: glycosyltransferase [Alphaproteobacteria bacterium]|nr:glycosyltransferase [Alphaproteobacteria bacterium]